MVAGSGCPVLGSYYALPPYAYPRFFHHVAQAGPVSYADALTPGYGYGDPSWNVVAPLDHSSTPKERYDSFMSKKPRNLTSFPTMPYLCGSSKNKTHSFGLSRKSVTRSKTLDSSPTLTSL